MLLNIALEEHWSYDKVMWQRNIVFNNNKVEVLQDWLVKVSMYISMLLDSGMSMEKQTIHPQWLKQQIIGARSKRKVFRRPILALHWSFPLTMDMPLLTIGKPKQTTSDNAAK